MTMASLLAAAALALCLPSRPSPQPPAVRAIRSALRHPPCRAVASDFADFGLSFPDEGDDEMIKANQLKAMAKSEANELPLHNRTMDALRMELVELGQKTTGNKKQLMERLMSAHNRLKRGMPISEFEVIPEENFKWYMLQTANGFEGTVARTIQQAINAGRLNRDVEKVFVPILEGETSVRESSVMPSYLFIRMRMAKNVYQLVSNLNYVVNFVGSDKGGRTANNQMIGNRGFVCFN